MVTKTFVLSLLLFSSWVTAGQYMDQCYSKEQTKWEADSCLAELEGSAKKKLQDKLAYLKEISGGVTNSPTLKITPNQLSKLAYSFENYSREHCEFIGGYQLGTGSGQATMDCNIRLLHSHIKDVDYLIKHYYE